jgi:hypothetical protein
MRVPHSWLKMMSSLHVSQTPSEYGGPPFVGMFGQAPLWFAQHLPTESEVRGTGALHHRHTPIQELGDGPEALE